MGLAEQLFRAGPHASAADVLSRYTEQQHQQPSHRNTTQSIDGSGAKKTGASDNSDQQLAGAITSDDVAKAVALIASSTSDTNGANWKANEFAAAICKHCPGLNWEDVVYRLPYSNLDVKHELGVAFVVDVFLSATAGQSRPFPYSFMYEIWPDTKMQVAFLRHALRCSSAAPHLLDKHMPAVHSDPLDTLYKAYHPEFTRLVASPWNSLSLILVLSHLLDSKAGDDARALLDAGIAQEPLLVTLALARLKIQHPRLQALLQHNIVRFLRHEFDNSGLFFELFRICDRKMLLAFFCSLHRKDAAFTRHILGVLADLGLANDMLLVPKREDIMMLDFIVELAIVASRRGMIVFESWFPGLLAELGTDMLHASLDILHTKLQLEAARQRGEDKGTAACSSAELATMFKALGTAAMSPNNAANLKALYAQFLELADELQRAEGDHGADDGQIEKEAETLFLRLYRGELSVDQMADALEDLRDSLRVSLRKTFAHVVQYPLEEFSFFDNYPDKELAITGQLVGTLVQRHMLPPASEPAILDMLLKALQAPATSKSFRFGMTALEACQARIEQLPVFCTAVCQIPGFRQSSGTPVVALVQSIIGAALPARGSPPESGGGSAGGQGSTGLDDGAEGSAGVDAVGAASSPVFFSVWPPVLPAAGEPYADPPEDTRDKIQFAVNNLARNNVDEKTGEVGRLLQARHFVWFSREVVVKRASQEPNYHSLYLHFLDTLDRPLLTRCVLCETLVSIARLLNAESTVHSSRDRGYLKNLGAWLGGFTLARNQPILRENVSFKELLCEGYRSQRLIVAIPFVCKVLEQAARSTIFHPPNPWLMGIMAVLSELYATANLKLNLTFEIEVLCKALALDVKEIPPAAILGRPAESTATDALAAELSKVVLGSSSNSAAVAATVVPAASAAAAAEGGSPVQMAVISGADITVDILGVLSQHASFQAADTLFAQQPTMKKMFYMLTERMIREIIPVHVSRSVFVAVSCTRDTVQKDFCGEPNEEHVHRAAQVMARGVAGALAVSLCREQLKSKLYLTMREFLIGHALPELSANSIAVGLVADNLDLACAIAEKEAIERASQQIDALLNEAYAVRRRTRERVGQPYYDMARHAQLAYPAGFPEVLKVRLSGLQAGHLRVYEDFTQIPHFFSQIGGGNGSSGGSGVGAGGAGVAGAHATEGKFSAAQSLERFAAIIGDLDRIVTAAGAGVALAQLPAQHEACLYARDILVLAARSASPDDTAMDFAQTLIGHLYRAETRLGIELYVLLLARMCEVSARAAKEVTSWLAFADDERKFNVAATVALINEGLVSVEDEDGQLARLVDAGRPAAVSFATRLVRKALAGGAVAVDARAFAQTLQSLARLAQGGRAPAAVSQLLDDVRGTQAPVPDAATSTPAAAAAPAPASLPALAEETASYQNILHNWTRVCEHPAAGDAELATLVRQLVQQTPLQEPRVEAAFFRACVDAAVASYVPGTQPDRAAPRDGHQTADALVRLVVYLMRLGVGGAGGGASLQPARMFLSSVALAIVHAHTTAPEAFGGQQRAYFRLLCGLLSELHAARRGDEPWCTEETFHGVIALLGEMLQMLVPAFVPGFAFVWLMLVSHRFFFPRLAERPECWPVAAGLLEAQLQFLEPFIVAGRITPALKLLYRGTVCVVLVVLHDFPEFLASYALRLCDAVPASCVQLRNLLLSAYPRSMRLPEPLTPNLKIDLLPDIARSPDIPFAYTAALESTGLVADLDAFLQKQQPADFGAGVIGRLQEGDAGETARYNTPVVNAFVLHAVVRITLTGDEAAREATQRAALDMFRALLGAADPEGRYLVISAIANQLRFPSSHTYLCSRMVLALFAKSSEAVRECIARVLVERILVNRPFPWGLLVTLIELLRNPFYAFWSHEFTHASPQIADILAAVAKSIHLPDSQAQQQQQQQQ
ncbi:CCR4-NOT core subunit cdc39 [Coemansia biformis]|uniref:General negative regulator of transcription subunit 1 n=1 Tax=Coemansia biformis TaxID=1286918 RepID=A0A9W7YH59_9FUNG|nr:CCR4-NOT core subunit cdc39 [Coemansia biformis]